jgi:glycosyltransferase involved in cell wall biosynthesis
MNKINFSVIIPAYENNKFLLETLYSVYKQKFQPNEVLIVDTSKRGINKSIINQFNNEHLSKFKYYRFKNVFTEGKARNLAALKTKSSYLAFLDDDDYWDENYLLHIKKILKKKYDVIFTQLKLVNDKKIFIKNHIISKKIDINNLYLYNPGTFTSNMITKKSTFFKIGMFDEDHGFNDKEYLIKIILNNFNYKIFNKFLVFRRVHKNQASVNYVSHLKDNIIFYLRYSKNLSTPLKLRYIKKIILIFFKIILKLQFYKFLK